MLRTTDSREPESEEPYEDGISINDLKIEDWTREVLGSLALYWKKTSCQGFDFMCVEFVKADSIDSSCIYDSPMAFVENVVSGNVRFDGFNHLYFGERGDGYSHYTPMRDLIKVLSRLEELALLHCEFYAMYKRKDNEHASHHML